MQKEERLRERHFGELEGKADSHYPEVWAFDAQNADHTQWQVEPVKRVAARMVAALEALEQRFEGETVLVVSHDRWFLDRIATHILAFEGEAHVEWFEGNYDDYEADRKRRLGAEAEQPHRIKYKKFSHD